MKVKETAKKPYGICPASMTIWNADQTYNKKGMEKYLTWLLDNGAQSISICGSTGENISMSDDEQKKIIECLVKFVDHQVPVYPGTGKYGTAQTIEMTKFAQKCGAEGALVMEVNALIPHITGTRTQYDDKVNVLRIETE